MDVPSAILGPQRHAAPDAAELRLTRDGVNGAWRGGQGCAERRHSRSVAERKQVVGILPQFLEVHFTNIVWAVIVASPVVGSFLGVVVERHPAGRQFLWGRSQCDACGHTLGALDLIPFASWLHSQGRCRYCRVKLSVFYPLIEFAALAVAVWSAAATAGAWFVASCVFGWLLLVVAIIEWRERRRLYVPVLAVLVWLACLYGPTILKLLEPRAS
jgi:hypothetical protein